MFYKVLTWDYMYAGLPDWTNITAEEKLSLNEESEGPGYSMVLPVWRL